MGSMQITVGIWFFLMDLKGEVMGSRGGTAIIMTYEGHVHVHVLHIFGREDKDGH